MAKMVTLAQY